MLCALSPVVGRSVDFTKYVGPLTADRHLKGIPAVAPHVEDTRRLIWWLVFESEWTVLFFVRWCSDVRQRKLMWRLPARLRKNLTTMGVEQLVLDSDFPLPVVQQWLTAHDTYDLGSQRRRYRMAGPSRDNPNGVYQDIVEFIHIFDTMGETLEAVGQLKPSSNQPEGPRPPDMTTETDQDPLLKTPPGARKSVSPDEKILASGSVPFQP
jgi:hypothetical protein